MWPWTSVALITHLRSLDYYSITKHFSTSGKAFLAAIVLRPRGHRCCRKITLTSFLEPHVFSRFWTVIQHISSKRGAAKAASDSNTSRVWEIIYTNKNKENFYLITILVGIWNYSGFEYEQSVNEATLPLKSWFFWWKSMEGEINSRASKVE